MGSTVPPEVFTAKTVPSSEKFCSQHLRRKQDWSAASFIQTTPAELKAQLEMTK